MNNQLLKAEKIRSGRETGNLDLRKRQIRIGDVTIDTIIERDGPWRLPAKMFPAYDRNLKCESSLMCEENHARR
jgi:hypothetical protein